MDSLLDRTLERVRRRAYEIWEREGRPEGRDADHWALAKEEIAIEDNLGGTLRPNPSEGPDDEAVRTKPVEPTLAIETQAEGIGPGGEEEP
jgi:hypothetical protein